MAVESADIAGNETFVYIQHSKWRRAAVVATRAAFAGPLAWQTSSRELRSVASPYTCANQ